MERDIFFRIYLFILFLHMCMLPSSCFRQRTYIWHKALLMGYSMILELICVCSLNDFQLVMGLDRGHPLFFLECVYLSRL